MNRFFFSILLATLLAWAVTPALALEHRSTRLGNPATRFADPLKTPEDLRRVLLDEKLREDVASILRQSGYLGDLEDFRKALASAEIREVQFPVGSLLPAMSTRLKGRPFLLRDVRWAGKRPIDAYEFTFISLGRRYKVVTPKPCSNFWVEEVLPRPLPVLALNCETPPEQPLPRPFSVCQQVTNNGDDVEAHTLVSLPIPADAKVESSDGQVAADHIEWMVNNLAPGASQKLCATFQADQPGLLAFTAAAVGERAARVENRCETQVHGIPAVLLEVIDLADPVLVGKDVVYTIRVLNQGSLALDNIRIVATLEDGQTFVSGGGVTAMKVEAATITAEPLARLNPQEEVSWQVVVKAAKAADMRFAVELRADQFARPIAETEATMQY